MLKISGVQELLKADYVEIEEIGAGGFGLVVKAKDIITQRMDAIKCVSYTRENITQINKEVSIMAKCDHPNIVKIFHAFQRENIYISVFFLVMELCDEDLTWHMMKSAPLTSLTYRSYMTNIIDGVRYLHANNILQRDLKPKNVFIKNGIAKIGDFGISKIIEGAGGTRNTVESEIFGTFSYMAPERFGGGKQGTSIDVWALGCIFYELIEGERAFPNESLDLDLLRLNICNLRYKHPKRAEPFDLAILKATLALRQNRIDINGLKDMIQGISTISGYKTKNSLPVPGSHTSHNVREEFKEDKSVVYAPRQYPSTSAISPPKKLPTMIGPPFIKYGPPKPIDKPNKTKAIIKDEDDAIESVDSDEFDLDKDSQDGTTIIDVPKLMVHEHANEDTHKNFSNLEKIDEQMDLTYNISKLVADPSLTYKTIEEIGSGIKYEGQWRGNEKEGYGILQIQGNIHIQTYNGYWKRDQMQGEGSLEYGNGDSFTGNWEMGKRMGMGKHLYSGGGYYEGEYKDDKRSGRGVMNKENYMYEGIYANNRRHGKGECTWSEGDFYSGEWANDRINGYGKYTWKDGSSYLGFWKKDLKHGLGTSMYPNGSQYQGEYVLGYRNGYGTYTYNDGAKYTGQWVRDLQHGNGNYVNAKGTITNGIWESGKLSEIMKNNL